MTEKASTLPGCMLPDGAEPCGTCDECLALKEEPVVLCATCSKEMEDRGAETQWCSKECHDKPGIPRTGILW